MQTSGVFTIHTFEIPIKSVSAPVYLIPFGDVHFGARNCSLPHFKRHIEWGKNRRDTYYLGMGDYLEAGSTSERRQREALDLHDDMDKDIDELYELKTLEFAKQIVWMKGRCVGLIEGNHNYRFSDRTTVNTMLARHLDTKDLGVMSLIRLTLNYQGCRSAIDICAYHGKGAARLLGSSLNTVQYMAENVEADLYLQGHDHKRGAIPGEKVRLISNPHEGLVLKDRTVLYCRTGAFLKSMEPGKASYAIDKGNGALPLGGIRIELWPRREKKDQHRHMTVEMRALV